MRSDAPPSFDPEVFRHTFEHVPIGMAVLKAGFRDGGELVYANPAMTAATGRRGDELLGLRFDDLAFEVDPEDLQRAWRAVAHEGRTVTLQGTVLRSDGAARWTELTLFSLPTADVSLVGVQIQDVTDRTLELLAQNARAEMTRVVAQAASVQGAMFAAMRAIAESLSFAFAAVWTPSDEDGEEHLRCAAAWQAQGHEAPAFHELSRTVPLAPGTGLPGRAWQSGAVETSADLGRDPRCPRASAAAADGLAGGLASPLLVGSRRWGVLELVSTTGGEADAELRQLVTGLTGELALLLADKQGHPGPEGTYLLLVEDNLVIARLVVEMLASAGFDLELDHVESLADARQRVIASRPACVLLDLTLPDAQELEALREITQVAPDVPVVVLSGIEDEATALRAMNEGAQDYLMKRTVDLQGLTRALRYAIERKGAQVQLTRQRLQDEVTGLPNRVLFTDRLKVALGRVEPEKAGVVLLNLDRFRTVNDTLGHSEGDRVLAEAAQRLLGLVPPEASVASFGGDEFAVLVESTRPHSLLELADTLREALESPYALAEEEVRLTASAGVACHADGDVERLLGEADAALSRAKKEGGGRAETFQETVRENLRERLRLERELREGIEAGQLRAFYQPLVALRSGEIVAFEALVRWEHPERGLLPPGDFLPLAEERNLSGALGDWVLREACEQLATWRRELANWSEGTMHVNLSASELADGELASRVERTLTDAGVPAGAVCLEVTETALIRDVALSQEVLGGLKEIGVAIALDDFGTGYSSLSYLERFPIDVLKLDRSFVAALRTHGRPAIVNAVASMAQGLRLPAVAEGVEHADEAAQLEAFGYDLAQGFLYARPLPAQQAAAPLSRRRKAGEP